MKFDIKLNSIEDVKKFCEAAENVDTDIFVKQGRYTIDAKSIMGIFSLNLLEILKLEINEMTESVDDFIDSILAMNIIA